MFRLLTLTGARRQEIAALHSDEVGEDLITIGRDRTKTRRGLIIPITPLVRAELDRCRQHNGVYLLGQNGATPFQAFTRGMTRLVKASGVDGWTLHDLRHAIESHLADAGEDHAAIDAMLNHSPQGIRRVYDQGRRVDLRRQAMERWHALLFPDASRQP